MILALIPINGQIRPRSSSFIAASKPKAATGKTMSSVAMAAIVDAFFENAAVRPETDLIEGIWCDSKATNTYSIWIRNNNRRVAEMLADAAEGALIRNSGGHNGISINLDRMFGETLAHRDPWWLYDEQE